MLGENLKQILNSIIEALEGIAGAMRTANASGIAVPSLNLEGVTLSGQTEILKESLNILLSKNVKTI